MDAKQVPLRELLASVPADARLLIDDADGLGSRSIPVGRLCQEAAAALEEPVQEPVAWVSKRALARIKDFDSTIYANGGFDDAVPLYTSPPQCKPLPLKTVEKLIYENTKINPNVADDRELLGYIVNAVRAIEKAHGIGGQP